MFIVSSILNFFFFYIYIYIYIIFTSTKKFISDYLNIYENSLSEIIKPINAKMTVTVKNILLLYILRLPNYGGLY